MDIVANLKALTEAGHHVHLGKPMQGNILADVAAKQVVTQKIIDAGGNLNDIPNENLAAAGIELLVKPAIMRKSTLSGLCTLSPSMKAPAWI